MKCQTIPLKRAGGASAGAPDGKICVCCQRYYPLDAEVEDCSQECGDVPALRVPGPCRHLGRELRLEKCATCKTATQIKVFACARHGECTLGKLLPNLACCAGCRDYFSLAGQPEPPLVCAPCTCSGPGWCEAFGRFQSPDDWRICRGQSQPPAVCDAQRAVWFREAVTSHAACCCRTEPRRSIGGVTVFGCRRHGLCTLVARDPDQVEAVCELCPDRQQLRPRLLARRRVAPEQLLRSEHAFNCSLARFRNRQFLAYRLHWSGARIALAELDESGTVVRNHRLPLRLGQAQEDPRLFVYREQLYVSYSAYYRRGEQQCIDVCYALLEETPSGRWTVAEEYYPHYPGRQPWEKNWGFFEHAGELLAVYSIAPHRILRIDGNRAELIAEAPVLFNKPGLLHGGAPPVFHRGEYYSFYHRRSGASCEKWYTLDLYTFEARPPFRPSRHIEVPLLQPDPRDRPGATVPHAVFPGGALIDEQHRWLVAYGYYDKWSEIAAWDINQIESCLMPLPGGPLAGVAARPGTNDLAIWKEVYEWNEYGLPDTFSAADVIVDVGAHIGAFTRACLDRGAGYCLAIEPFPETFQLLQQNLAYYPHRSEALQIALGGERGTMTLRNPDPTGTSYVAVSGHFGGTSVGEADQQPLAYVLPEGPVRLLKLDCEGAEYDVLAAAGDLANVQAICGEAHRMKWRGREATIEDLAALLAQRGFTVTSHATSPVTWLFTARR